MKTFKTNLHFFSSHYFLRSDVKYWKNEKVNQKNQIKFRDIFNIINGLSCTEYYTKEKTAIPYIRIGDLTFNDKINDTELLYLNEDTQLQEEKILKENDIVLATIGNTIGKVNIVEKKYIGGTFSNNTCLLRLKNNKIFNPVFLINFLQNKYMQYIINSVKSQKAQPNLQTYDLLNIKIPLIPLTTQNSIASQIASIEEKIASLKSQIEDPKIITNEVFSRYFDFDINKFNQLKESEKINKTTFSNFSLNRDLRNSVKFNRKSYGFLLDSLKGKNFKALKNFISDQILLGVSISPNEIDENGEYFYISMAELKNYKINLENVKKVNSAFYNKNINKSLEFNDIVIARSGEGTIGKCAIIEDEELNGVNADFTIKVRIDKNKYNAKFAYYYFCSFMFQYMIEVNKKGLGNNTNIFPSQIQDFLIPDISLREQEKIVNEIKLKIDKQNEINSHIKAERDKIDNLINSVLI